MKFGPVKEWFQRSSRTLRNHQNDEIHKAAKRVFGYNPWLVKCTTCYAKKGQSCRNLGTHGGVYHQARWDLAVEKGAKYDVIY